MSHVVSCVILIGEALIVCVVVSCPEPRPLHIRPKKSANRPLRTGDEQIEIVSAYRYHSVIRTLLC